MDPDQSSLSKKRGRPKKYLDIDKRMKRNIANENEKRRVHNINKGFEYLRLVLIRASHMNYKPTKARILERTLNYINHLENSNNLLHNQILSMKQQLIVHQMNLNFSNSKQECKKGGILLAKLTSNEQMGKDLPTCNFANLTDCSVNNVIHIQTEQMKETIKSVDETKWKRLINMKWNLDVARDAFAPINEHETNMPRSFDRPIDLRVKPY